MPLPERVRKYCHHCWAVDAAAPNTSDGEKVNVAQTKKVLIPSLELLEIKWQTRADILKRALITALMKLGKPTNKHFHSDKRESLDVYSCITEFPS